MDRQIDNIPCTITAFLFTAQFHLSLFFKFSPQDLADLFHQTAEDMLKAHDRLYSVKLPLVSFILGKRFCIRHEAANKTVCRYQYTGYLFIFQAWKKRTSQLV